MQPYFVVYPRWRAQLCDPGVRHVIISITDPPPDGGPLKAPIRFGREGVLRLEFDDFDLAKIGQHDAYLLDSAFRGRTIREWAMQPEHAVKIWDFMEQHADVEAVIVHCEAGASRSPSVAMALADVLGIKRGRVHSEGHNMAGDPPNRHVYDLVRAEGMRRMREMAQ